MTYYLVKKEFNNGRDGVTHYVGEQLEYKNDSMVVNQNGDLVFKAGSDNFRNVGQLVEEQIEITYQIVYWADEERREMGESDIYLDEIEDLSFAKSEAKRLVDRGTAVCAEVRQEDDEETGVYTYDGE